MPTNSHHTRLPQDGLEDFLARVSRLNSKRKPRPVVTPSGKRARGNFPSIKAPAYLRYESLLELDVLRVLEVSSKVRVLRTHPVVLALPGDPVMHYTPDVQLEWPSGGAIVETKAEYFLTLEAPRRRLKEIAARLAQHELHLVVIVGADVRAGGLQEELKDLLRLRPRVGRYRPGLDKARWDPLGTSTVDIHLEKRWRAAQNECNELLERVMRRDPGELIAAAN